MRLKEELAGLYGLPSVFNNYTMQTRMLHDQICLALDQKVPLIVESIIGTPIKDLKRDIYSSTFDIQYNSDDFNVSIYNTDGHIIFAVLANSPISLLPGKIKYFKVEVDEDFNFVSAHFEKRINMTHSDYFLVFINEVIFNYVLNKDMKLKKMISFTSSSYSLDPTYFYDIHGPFKKDNEFDDLVFKICSLYHDKKELFDSLFENYVDITNLNKDNLKQFLEMLYADYSNNPDLLYSKLGVFDMAAI